jgi:hypothetical protein
MVHIKYLLLPDNNMPLALQISTETNKAREAYVWYLLHYHDHLHLVWFVHTSYQFINHHHPSEYWTELHIKVPKVVKTG